MFTKSHLFLIFLLFLFFSCEVFGVPITGEEYVKSVRKLKPSKNIYALLQDPLSGAGYVEVRGAVKDFFEIGQNRYFTLMFSGKRPGMPEFVYINIPADMDKDDLENKELACVLKWNVISLNQNTYEIIQLNQDEHYDIEYFSYLDSVIYYEDTIKDKSMHNNVTPYGKVSSFVMPTELSRNDEITENRDRYNYVSGHAKNKIINIISSVNTKLSPNVADNYADYILTYSAGHGVDPLFVCAIITQESRFRNTATSKAGAQGLGQIMPGTASGLGISNAYDPKQNIYGTAKYLKNAASSLFGKVPRELTLSQLKLLAASYNAGTGAVKKYNGVPPYNETQNFVAKVLGYYFKYLKI